MKYNRFLAIRHILFELTIDAPGSKSITNRALMLAALANGETLLKGALFSDDSRHFLQCLKDLGFDVVVDEPAHTVRVTGLGGRIPKETAAINVGSAGTAARFLTAMLGCAKGVWHLDASEQMKKRPMAALLNTLTDLGCRIDCHEKEGYFPFYHLFRRYHRFRGHCRYRRQQSVLKCPSHGRCDDGS